MVINRWLNSVASAGKHLLRRSTRERPSIASLCSELYSNKGEALGIALADEVVEAYNGLTGDEKSAFFDVLLRDYSPDPELINRCAEAYRAALTPEAYRALARAVESPRQTLFRRINMAPTGTRTVVNMREDLLERLPAHPELRMVDDDLQHLLSSWFNPGFLQLRTMDWQTPAVVLEKLIEYEAVHEMQGWDDLRRRLDAKDRRCFGFFHPALPDEPLIFVEVALVTAISSSVQTILAPHEGVVPQQRINTAIFYSISNCQPGLRGISFGNFLIKQVVMRLKDEMPQLNEFATLSPIPGFRKWLTSVLANEQQPLLSAEDASLLTALDTPRWLEDSALQARLKPLLMRLCARYLVQEKRGSSPLDPVARFHLGNGASVARLNWLGDTSAKGLRQSAGLLVNYAYDLEEVEEHHEAFLNRGEIACAPAVKKLLAS
ncbi:MAG: decarboxylase [Haliea sp.]|uniref:malonyl-CoA decarboxylase n=1 Tax=Haliea sp. TaxID=1932666 RepID=UPI000C564A6D|nr:malonyl-CoA decarboxylase [Haliea sp.]MBM68621.1 decarboxylase [Haliea sp.]|tara:strand:+ start:46729 stop:48033 length:1305 start_codon:yes stop_codon:yes gene_type:complete